MVSNQKKIKNMYQRQFNYTETKQAILADIFNILKDKGYNTNEPILIPNEMEGISIGVRAFDKYLDVDYILNMEVTEIQPSIDALEIIGFSHDSDEDCDFLGAELDIDSLSNILNYVKDMPEAKDATYDEEE